MYVTLPRPTIKCSKCGSMDIAIPERSANGPSTEDDAALLRCRSCGHEKRSGHKQRFDDLLSSSIGTETFPKEETF